MADWKYILVAMRPVLTVMLVVLLAPYVSGSPASEVADQLSSADLVQVGAGEAVQIRSLLSLTGAPSLGPALRYGVELAVRDYGDVHGHAIELGDSLDSRCTSDGGREGAQRIIADPQVIGVIGTSCSAAAVAASPVLSAAGLVMVSPSNTSPLLTSDLAGNAGSEYHPGYFRVSINDLYGSIAGADFAYDELGLRRMGTVHDGDPYTSSLVNAFAAAFRARGGEVVATAEIERGDTDMTAILSTFATARTDGMFFPLFLAEGSAFAQQARAFDGLQETALFTGAVMLAPGFLGTPYSEGTYIVGPESAFGGSVNAATGKDAATALAAFHASYGEAPTSPYWAFAYDATTLLLSAIESAAVVEGDMLTLDRAALRATLTATHDFHGIIGTLSCDAFGDCGTGRINVYDHQDSGVTDAASLPVVYRFVP